MLSPLAIAGRLVVNARQEVEVVERHLLGVDAELVLELAPRRVLDARHRVLQVAARLAGDAQRVRAARVGPHVRERDLLRRALLQQQLVVRVEEEDGEGAMQQALVDVGHEVAYSVAEERLVPILP